MGNFYKDASVVDICSQHTHAFGVDVSISPEATTIATRPTVH